MRPLFVVSPVSSWRKRYVQNYVFAFCACGWGQVLFRIFLAGQVCFYVFMFPENKPVDKALIPLKISIIPYYFTLEPQYFYDTNGKLSERAFKR
jgi:hypothetical protein